MNFAIALRVTNSLFFDERNCSHRTNGAPLSKGEYAKSSLCFMCCVATVSAPRAPTNLVFTPHQKKSESKQINTLR